MSPTSAPCDRRRFGPTHTLAGLRGFDGHPDQSRDPKLRTLTPAQYLPYALNTYRVLLTRGTHATHIHATDAATHHFLNQLIQRG